MPAINKDYDLQLLSSTGTSIDKSAQITGANEIISAYIPTTTGIHYVYVYGYEGSTSTYPNYNATTCYELKVASLIVIDSTAPTTPTLTASGTTQTTTNLSWTAASDNIGVTGYNIYNGTTLLGTTTTATTYAVSGLTEATAYTFAVRAFNDFSEEKNTLTYIDLFALFNVRLSTVLYLSSIDPIFMHQ